MTSNQTANTTTEDLGPEHDAFRRFAAACLPILSAGFEHAAKADPELYAFVMDAISTERAITRLVVSWDRLYAVVAVEAAGQTPEGETVSFPMFEYRLHRELPAGAH